MVKLGSPFVLYGSTNSSIKVKTIESTPSKGKRSFPFIASGTSLRDYVKRKLFKATKEEVSGLIKSTSSLNLAAKFSPKSSKSKVSKKSKQPTVQNEVKFNEFEASNLRQSNDDQSIGYETVKQSEVISIECEGQSIIESSIEEPTVELKPCRRFSLARLSRRKKKTRFADDLTQSLPAPSSSISPPSPSSPPLTRQSKLMKWSKKMRKSKVKPYEPIAGKVPNAKSNDKKGEELEEPIRWTKRVRKFAIRTCRYLGYGAQMVSPLTPYTDIPMPVTYDATYNIYPPYYGSNHYYSYSSCGSVYGYKMSHYGLTY